MKYIKTYEDGNKVLQVDDYVVCEEVWYSDWVKLRLDAKKYNL